MLLLGVATVRFENDDGQLDSRSRAIRLFIGAALVLSAPRLWRRPWLAAIAASAGGVQLHVALSGRSIVARSAQLQPGRAERVADPAAETEDEAAWVDPIPVSFDSDGVAVDGAYVAADARF